MLKNYLYLCLLKSKNMENNKEEKSCDIANFIIGSIIMIPVILIWINAIFKLNLF